MSAPWSPQGQKVVAVAESLREVVAVVSHVAVAPGRAQSFDPARVQMLVELKRGCKSVRSRSSFGDL